MRILLTTHRDGLVRGLVGVAVLLLIASAVSFQSRELSPDSRQDFRFTPIELARAIQIGVNRNVLEFREVRDSTPLGRALGLLVAGGLALTGAAWLSRSRATFAAPTGTLPPWRVRPTLAGLLLLGGVGLLWVAAEANGQWFGLWPELHQRWQVAAFVGGVLLVGLGLGGVPRARAPKLTREAGWVLGITFLGGALRVWQLDLIRVLVDEAHYTTAALSFLQGERVAVLTPMTGISPFPWLYAYGTAATAELFGQTLATQRLFSAFLGTLGLPALYWLAREAFDRPTALLSLVLLASFPVHIHFSRMNQLHMGDALFGTLALAALMRALRTGARADYALGGVLLGLSQYFYEGGRLLFPAVVGLWLAGGWWLWGARYPARGVLVMALGGLLVAAPLYYTLAGLDHTASGRLDTVGLGGGYWTELITSSLGDDIVTAQMDRLQNPFLLVVSVPDSSLFYGGRGPLLLVYVAPLFFLGLWHSVRGIDRPGGGLLIVWLLLPPLGMSLLLESGISVRFIVALPAFMLTAAVGLRYTLPWLVPARWVGPIAGVLVVLIAAGGMYYYFNLHVDTFNQQFRITKPYPDGEDALLRSAALPPDTHIMLISDPVYPETYAHEVANWVLPGRIITTRTSQLMTPDFIAGLSPNRPYAFFLEPDDLQTLGVLREHFNLQAPQRSPYADDIPDARELLLYYAPPFTLESPTPRDWEADP